MEKFLKYLIIILPGISLIFLIISCSKETRGLLPAETILQSASSLHVGVAMADITPDNPLNVQLVGYGDTPRLSTGAHDPLTARCMVLSDGKSVVALVSLDLIGLYMKHVEDMKQLIIRETGLKDENIFIHSIHTHSGPDMLGDDRYNGAYRAKINRGVTDCILEAFKVSKKATALISTGNSLVKTVNRRYPQKRPANKFTSIEFQDSVQHTIAMLLNFGCHPVVLGPDNLKITADYVYYFRKKVEEKKGGLALFINSRFGDVNPPPMAGKNVYTRDGGTFDMAQEMGEQLAQDIIQASLNNDTI
jgi:neutral ceramidase